MRPSAEVDDRAGSAAPSSRPRPPYAAAWSERQAEHRIVLARSRNTTVPPGPIFFDRYIATSAWLQQRLASIASRGNTPIPMRGRDGEIDAFERRTARSKSSCTRSATDSTTSKAASVPAGSPGRSLQVAQQQAGTHRRSVAPPCRSRACSARRRRPAGSSRSSPATCPRLSFTSLKLSRSMKMTPTARSNRRARAMRALELLLEARTVRQTRQLVVVRQDRRSARSASLRSVMFSTIEIAYCGRRRGRVGGRGDVPPHQLSVLTAVALLDLVGVARPVHHLLEQLLVTLDVIRVRVVT